MRSLVFAAVLLTCAAHINAGSGPLTLELRGLGGQLWQTFTVTINVQ
ncbi:MAG: hypothetical protein JSS00_02075 [Proteobacteria bacterium]|nr:hypothetical protein [Pseudomonadota bacterium]